MDKWSVTYTQKIRLPGTWQRISLRVAVAKGGLWQWVVCSPFKRDSGLCPSVTLAKAAAVKSADGAKADYLTALDEHAKSVEVPYAK